MKSISKENQKKGDLGQESLQRTLKFDWVEWHETLSAS